MSSFDPETALDLDALLHPSRAYAHPKDVLRDPDLTTWEKRAILSSWASDACAVPSDPAMRQPPGAPKPVTFDEVINCLKTLDEDDPPPRPGGARMRVRRNVADPDQGGWGQQL